ncbi:MAG: alpha-amylase, partial [Anaerolineae bacterium]|nr:alpha-amylase [Anaerolineae bacterium]
MTEDLMLQRIIERLESQRRRLAMPYFVPGLWVDAKSTTPQAVNPYDFYAGCFKALLERPPAPLVTGEPGGDWSRRALVYNLFPRVTAAYPHAGGDNRVRIEPRPDGWRDTGTLLKATALLPYIQSMGFNTVHLLPITSVGQAGKKGTLGSPYGIQNHYKLDANLAEPALDFTAEDLFKGFVEAAHHLGLRVVMEFVPRTTSKDGDWIKEHPEWFYWIRESVPDRQPGTQDRHAYGNPIFDGETLVRVKAKVEAGDFEQLPPPPQDYIAMFTKPPRSEQVTMEHGAWIGTLDDGTRVRVPGAFADWPPDDNQPPWTDVTYLRLYDHKDFNYIAYNTIRMYDTRFATPENRLEGLWDAIVGIVPYYQERFGIDGVMLDMGHALPLPLKHKMVEVARQNNPDFAFWEENFAVLAASRREGYNAVMGYMVFDLDKPNLLRLLIERMATEPLPLPFLATAENHNTPRAATRQPNGIFYSYYALPLCIATSGIPFLHSGFELGETQPINTGLQFTDEMIKQYPSEKLPLFSEYAYDWSRRDNLVDGVRYALELRQRYADLLSANDPATWRLGQAENGHILCFTRTDGDTSLTFIANTDMLHQQGGRVLI